MGIYVNPGNSGFEEIKNSRYVDKTGMISLINRAIGTTEKLICISRPRRFGKSFAAQMLCAYYDKTCDSSDLFDDLMQFPASSLCLSAHYTILLTRFLLPMQTILAPMEMPLTPLYFL